MKLKFRATSRLESMMRFPKSCLMTSTFSLFLPVAAFAQSPDSTDGWNRDWQWRFSADAVYMQRDNSSNQIPVIDGPEAFRFRDFDFDKQYGSRFSLGLMEDDYEFEVSFLALKDWDDSRAGVLSNGLDFDGDSFFGAAAGGAQMAVDSGSNPNFVHSETYFSSISAAANGTGETDALDYLQQGASFQARYSSDLQDVEANYKQRSQPGRWLRWGLGFRSVTVREDGLAALSGTFGSVDADGIGAPGTPGLSSAALASAGLTSTGTVNDGFLAGDSLLMTTRAQTRNRLNGVQAISELKYFESDYLDLGGFGKLGVFHNDASGSISEQYVGTGSNASTYQRTLSDSKHAVAFVAHAGLTGRVHLRRNIHIVAGYEALYVAGLALAPDQVEASLTPVSGAASLDLRTDGAIFIHGGRVGLEFLFP